ncbi:hypothetical protein PDL04_26705 [Bacillus cereus group sp. BY142LC]|uniref:hypothetical protein n=1 Tax=Bacillus cereus group sp. BY142LC TaxID=3018083 RepID=UPI0022E1BF4A|nr:hypothetical protein [Bacillus cereus group sp. BY142LC]MDA1835042.1 hypothetical protein [Bacillus cereus group sp. BY142LC]
MDFIKHMERTEAMEYYNADTLEALDVVIGLVQKEYEVAKQSRSKGEDTLIFKRTEGTEDAQKEWGELYDVSQELTRMMRLVETLDKLRGKVETKAEELKDESQL